MSEVQMPLRNHLILQSRVLSPASSPPTPSGLHTHLDCAGTVGFCLQEVGMAGCSWEGWVRKVSPERTNLGTEDSCPLVLGRARMVFWRAGWPTACFLSESKEGRVCDSGLLHFSFHWHMHPPPRGLLGQAAFFLLSFPAPCS